MVLMMIMVLRCPSSSKSSVIFPSQNWIDSIVSLPGILRPLELMSWVHFLLWELLPQKP
jgi:hypothetical protein